MVPLLQNCALAIAIARLMESPVQQTAAALMASVGWHFGVRRLIV
jgi:hypothetical protein